MSDLARIALAARIFTLTVITSAAFVGGVDLGGVWMVLGIAGVAQGVTLTGRLPQHLVASLEGAATGIAVVVAFPANEVVLPYLATPVLICGVARGLGAVASALTFEAVAITLAWWLYLGRYESGTAGSVVTWLVTGLGLGILGTFTRRSILQSDSDSSYRDALALIRRLHDLSGRLTSGLDPVDLADQTMALVAEDLVVRQAAVVLHHDGEFVPLRYSDGAMRFSLADAEQLLHKCWQTRRPVLGGARVALPLLDADERVAVVLVECAWMPDQRAVDRAMERLSGEAVRLNAALLFTDVREAATSEERLRIAREVHDGVAQDVASLGYLVDSIAAGAQDEEQQRQIAMLRREVTRVVGELRNSVFDLRNEVRTGQGLGQSIASFARHVGSHSPLTVHVTLDESTVRMPPRVEAELLRIAQEGINNARRHSGGQNLWVNCSVSPPHARIEVVDDGDGLGKGRDDSHGLRIMRERASRIGAHLVVESPAFDGRGTRVAVTLDS